MWICKNRVCIWTSIHRSIRDGLVVLHFIADAEYRRHLIRDGTNVWLGVAFPQAAAQRRTDTVKAWMRMAIGIRKLAIRRGCDTRPQRVGRAQFLPQRPGQPRIACTGNDGIRASHPISGLRRLIASQIEGVDHLSGIVRVTP